MGRRPVQREADAARYPAHASWHAMLQRLDREESERRLADMERALNGERNH